MKKTVMIVGALLMVGILIKPVNVGAAELSDKQKDSREELTEEILDDEEEQLLQYKVFQFTVG